jgi:spermidine synthase
LFVSTVSMSFEDPFLTVVLARVGSPTNKLVAHQEDRGATISVLESAEGTRTLYINGLYTSNTAPGVADLMVNFPLAFDPETGPKRILAVGLGVGEALRYSVDAGHHVTVVELHEAVIDIFRQLNPDAGKYLDSGRGSVVIEDGRNFLLRTQEAFDLVLVDGSPPLYASGMANLYSIEFMMLVKQHLRPNGVFALWFPVVCFERDFWNVFRSFSDTFRWTQLHSVPREANALFVGSHATSDPFSIDFPTFAARLERWPRGRGANAPGFVWAASRYDQTVLRRHAAAFPPATDDRPYTEFPLQAFLRGDPYLSDNRFLADAFRRW